MLDILDIPTLRERMAPISVEKYHRMIESGIFDDWDVELLDGVLVKKISKSELHVYFTDLFVDLVRSFCGSGEFWVRKEDPITIGNSEPEPDLSVIKGQRSDFRYCKPQTALFVAEVAISSFSIDLAKAVDYAAAEVAEYWVIRPEEKLIKVFQQPVNGRYEVERDYDAQELIESVALPGFEFRLADHLE